MDQFFREYVVTLKDRTDLDQFYLDMEQESTIPYVPFRAVECVLRKPLSRSTHYLITEQEAKSLRNDERIQSVSLNLPDLGIKTKLHSSQVGDWNRSNSIEVDQKNWGLYRMSQTSNAPGWGSEQGLGSLTKEVKFRSTGKNVDIVVVDDIMYPDHPEYSDRFVEYDWFGELDLTVRGSGTTIVGVLRTSDQATVTTQTAHKLFPGSVVKVVCSSDPTFNSNSAVILSTLTPTSFTYSNVGSEVPQTEGSGFWNGIYQYDRFNGQNNHATHVAAIIAGNTQGWAREANLYNLRHDTKGLDAGEYVPREFIFDYIRAFHAAKPINPETGRKNPTLVNCSWGLGKTVSGGLVANPVTQNNKFSAVFNKGQLVTAESLGSTPVDTGYSGVCSASAEIVPLATVVNGGNEITTTSGTEGTCTGISKNILGRTGLTNLGNPTGSSVNGVDIFDDAFWTITLPFDIEYTGVTYGPSQGPSQNYINISSNSSIFFGGAGSAAYDLFVGAGGPAVRKIHISANDRSCQSLWYGVSGVSPSRSFRIRWEGHEGAYGGDPLNPTIVWEATFFEETPNRIELHIDQNAAFRGEFTVQQLEDLGIMQNGNEAPVRDASIDADVVDALDDGIFFVASAGNGKFKLDVTEGEDYDNYFLENGLEYHYHKGPSPAAAHPNIICVGALDSSSGENKLQLSNTGPRVDLYAPGSNVISAVYDDTGFTLGASQEIVNDGSVVLDTEDIQSVSRNQSLGLTTVVTTSNHNLSNGDLITVRTTDDSTLNVSMTEITVTNSTTFTYSNSGTDVVSFTPESMTISSGYQYQKSNGSSVASAQVAGLLALLLEVYPDITQAEAKEYLLQNSMEGLMTDFIPNLKLSSSVYTDDISLQGGANKIAFYYKERPTEGLVYPKPKEWLRPTSGLVFPRPKINRS
jgi:hypothetical protein